MKTLLVRTLDQPLTRRIVLRTTVAEQPVSQSETRRVKGRRYFAWIESAKREETKLRRLKEAIRLLASGKVLGLK